MEWPIPASTAVLPLFTPSGTNGVTLTSAASANAKGGWTTLTSGVGYTIRTLQVVLSLASGNGRDYLVDIGTGASGSEVVLISNLLYTPGSDDVAYSYQLPCHIPENTRIAARVQCSTANSSLQIAAYGFTASFLPGLSTVTTHGANTSTSGGVSIDPGATVDVKGSYAEIVNSTPRHIKALVVAIGNARNNNQVAQYRCFVDIAMGSAGAEVDFISNLFFQVDVNSDARLPNVFGPYPVNIPPGTRLAARGQCSGNDATDRLFHVVLYGCT
jgi:hypothetical protein